MRRLRLICAILIFQSSPLLAADKLSCTAEQNIGFMAEHGNVGLKSYSSSHLITFTLERDAHDRRKFTERVPNDPQGVSCHTLFDISGKENVFCEDKWQYRLQVALTTGRFTYYHETNYLDGIGPDSDVHLEIGNCAEGTTNTR